MKNKDSRLIIVSNYFTREHTLYVFEDSNCKEETPNSWDKLINLIMDTL